MATLIHANGREEPFPLPSHPHLVPRLREVIGGPLEFVPFSDGRYMIVNEDGGELRLPKNARATAMAAHILVRGDYIKGPAVVCQPGEFQSADSSGVLD